MQHLFLFLLFFVPLITYTQNSIHTSGGDAVGSSGSVSYSIGQTFYQNYSSSAGNIQQGVQQTYEIITTALEEPDKEWNINFRIFPNPSSDIINIELTEKQDYSLQLFSIEGKLIYQEEVYELSNTIDMQNFPVASYILKLKNSENKIKTYKVIKK